LGPVKKSGVREEYAARNHVHRARADGGRSRSGTQQKKRRAMSRYKTEMSYKEVVKAGQSERKLGEKARRWSSKKRLSPPKAPGEQRRVP